MAQQVQLSYTTLCGAGSATTTDYDVLSCRGSAEPDDFELFPNVRHEFLDGSLAEQIAGGRRNIELVLRVISAALDRRKLVDFWLDPNRAIVCLATAPTVTAGNAINGGTLTIGLTYYYRVCAIDAIGNSAGSTAVSKQAGPGGGESNRTIPLTWPAIANARQYKIFRSADAEATYDLIDYSSTNSYTDAGTAIYIAAVTVPSAATSISVVTSEPNLVSTWVGETELARGYSLVLRENTINTRFLV